MGITGLLLAGALAIAPAPSTLSEAVALARGGAPGLALSLLDELQARAPEPAAWVAAERERVHILAAGGAWRELAERVSALPDGMPPPFVAWANERRAEALLQLGDGAAARAIAAGSIWGDPVPEPDALRALRMLIVRSHQVDGDLDDALVAMSRYAQDYGAHDPALVTRYAEALLAAERPADALHALGDVDGPLKWLAALRAGTVPAGQVFEQAVRTGSARSASVDTRRAAWRVAGEAATRLRNRAAAVAAFERALATPPSNEPMPHVLQPTADDLWHAYHEWGRALGNEARLIVGVVDGWRAAADARAGEDAVGARALYATLYRDAGRPEDADALARSLAAEPGGEHVLAALFAAPIAGPPALLPAGVRRALTEPALANGELRLAAELMRDLEAPDGADPFWWELRRARVEVLAGDRAVGSERLVALLARTPGHDPDAALQVVFDLQRGDAHVEALRVLTTLVARDDLPVQLRRELHYWIAESYRALDAAAEAARHYLRSAMAADPYAMDPWAQTARFEAAQSLAHAGLVDDAVNQLQSLLNATDDDARRAGLARRIDELRQAADTRR